MIALACFLIAFATSYFGTVGLLRIPMVRGFVDVPNERSSHEAPKPRIGGVAIVVSFFVALAFLFAVEPSTRTFLPFTIGAGLLFVAGLLDDWRGLGVKVRFAIQIVAALTVISFGVTLDHIYIPAVGVVSFGWLSIPLTILAILVSINFYNFIDGIDGLAAGSAFIASGFLALVAMMLGHIHFALLLVAAAGSAIGFLQFNCPPSRLFMGDSGSTFLGFFFAYVAIAGNRLEPEIPVFITMLILSSLYLDAGLTLFNRIVKRENIFQPHHTHYYQRLLSLGLNHKQVTLLEYLLVIMLGVSALIYFKAGGFFPIFLSICWFVLFTLAILKIRGLERGDKLFWEKRMLFVIGLDLILITVAYLGAYFLRMNLRFTEPEGVAVIRALPIVLVVRSAVFFRYGLYRSVYKYTSTADIVRILKAITVGSAIILTAVVLLYRFVAFPRTLFIIEFFLLTLLILGSRFSFRLFHELGKEAQGTNLRRFGIIGAGDFGERVARELRSDAGRSSVVVCFIDDDPGKIGLMLHGAPIEGPITRLGEICANQRLDSLVLGISRLESGKMKQLADAANAAGVSVEGGPSALRKDPEPIRGLFELLAQGLRRDVFSEVGTSAKVFYRGKRVLLTGGGGPIGAALARELIIRGASVTVQVESARDAANIGPALRRDVFMHAGAPRDSGDWRLLLERCSPDVVFHCLPLDVDADSNVDEYLWEAAISSTIGLTQAAGGDGAPSVVMLSFWEGPGVGKRDAGEAGWITANVGAAAEALLLNVPMEDGPAPIAIRFPRVFTESALFSAYHRRSRDASDATTAFALLEPEAVALALDCAAAEPGPAIVVPWEGRLFSPAEAAVILSGGEGGDLGTRDVGARFGRAAGPMFPAESIGDTTASGRGVRLDSPVCPAVGALARVLTNDFQGALSPARAEWLTMITESLYRLADTGDRAEGTAGIFEGTREAGFVGESGGASETRGAD